VRPGISSSEARCFLKNKTAMEVQSPCCVAGYEQHAAIAPAAPAMPTAPAAPAPAAAAPIGAGPLPNTNFFGADYRNIVLASDNWSLCQNACRADSQCLAWTAVHPGIQGPNARCWLKNKIPRAMQNSCCTSGVEHGTAE
jgi:hypothetical protein